MAQNVDITISETVQQVTVDLETTVVEVDVTIAPEELAKIEAANAQVSATAAATSEQNAATSESNAQTSANNAATSESNAQTSANNAATSESNAADDASDAEKHAQETAAFTDSDGVNFDKGAKGYSEDAEAARDEITDKIDFTDLQEGDIIRHDGAKLVRESEVEFLSRKETHEKSIYSSFLDANDFYAWDSFNRNSLGTETDNGLTYNVDGSTTITDGVLYPIVTPETVTVDTGFGGLHIQSRSRVSTSNSLGSGVIIGKDANNYIIVQFIARAIRVSETTAGVTTTLFQTAKLDRDFMRSLVSPDNLLSVKYYYKGVLDKSSLLIVSELYDNITLDITSLNSVYATASDIAYAGVYMGIAGANCNGFFIRKL